MRERGEREGEGERDEREMRERERERKMVRSSELRHGSISRGSNHPAPSQVISPPLH